MPRFGRRSSEALPLNEPIRPVVGTPIKLSGRLTMRTDIIPFSSFASRYAPLENVADNVLFPRSLTATLLNSCSERSEKSSGSPFTNAVVPFSVSSNCTVSESACLPTTAVKTVASTEDPLVSSAGTIRACKVNLSSEVCISTNSPLPLKVYLCPSRVIICGSPNTKAAQEIETKVDFQTLAMCIWTVNYAGNNNNNNNNNKTHVANLRFGDSKNLHICHIWTGDKLIMGVVCSYSGLFSSGFLLLQDDAIFLSQCVWVSLLTTYYSRVTYLNMLGPRSVWITGYVETIYQRVGRLSM